MKVHFGYEPTPSQEEAIGRLANFIYEKGDHFLFLLRGYAGTGKTTLVSALVNALEDVRVRTVLLAPTGRAAKVLSQYAGKKAYTIHKWIYRVSTRQGLRRFVRKENIYSHTLFIVDEASMISADANMGEITGLGSLLEDSFHQLLIGIEGVTFRRYDKYRLGRIVLRLGKHLYHPLKEYLSSGSVVLCLDCLDNLLAVRHHFYVAITLGLLVTRYQTSAAHGRKKDCAE